MTLGKNRCKSDRARLLFAILLNLMFLAVLLLCFEVRFEENDDLTVDRPEISGRPDRRKEPLRHIHQLLSGPAADIAV